MQQDVAVHLRKLTRREFRQRLQGGELTGCIIPTGAIEQHLEHLAMEHDWRSVSVIAEQVARRLAPRVIVAEGLMCGISEHHMNHPGTMNLRVGTFLSVIEDMIDSMTRAGFKNIVVLNGHGGNIEALQAAWQQFQRRFKVNLHFISYWDTLTPDDAKELLKSGCEMPQHLPGHAQEFETACALAAFPENVRTDMWKDQADPLPSLASAESGKVLLGRAIDRVTDFVAEVIDGKRDVPIPKCFP